MTKEIIKIDDNTEIALKYNHNRFCYLVATKTEPTEAYQEIYKTNRSNARKCSYQLMRNPNILLVIEFYSSQVAETIKRTENRKIALADQLAETTAKGLFDDDGEPLQIQDIPQHVMACCDVIMQKKVEHSQATIDFNGVKKKSKGNYDIMIKFNSSVPQKARDFLHSYLFDKSDNKKDNKNKQLLIEKK